MFSKTEGIVILKKRHGQNIGHTGDCHINSLSEICTCGLIIDLQYYLSEDQETIKKYCPKFEEELRKHLQSLDALAFANIDK